MTISNLTSLTVIMPKHLNMTQKCIEEVAGYINKLLAFKKNRGFVFPALQFKNARGLLLQFEDVMKKLNEEIGPVARISFLNTPLVTRGNAPLEIMQSDNGSEDVALMSCAASQMGEQIAS